jgi:beta-lactamase superfamily II metal-dependent hydrolase
MLFAGDLEKAGWKALLQTPAFVVELAHTDILVASHHGRENGYCEDIFKCFTPQAIVISDKPIAHETQKMVPDYRAVVNANGVTVTNQLRRRHVLTTRRDGDIIFRVTASGTFWITTTKDSYSLKAA